MNYIFSYCLSTGRHISLPLLMDGSQPQNKSYNMKNIADKPIRESSLTDDGEIDAAVAGGRSFEIDSASVESGVRFVNVVDRQTGTRWRFIRNTLLLLLLLLLLNNFGEKRSFTQDVLVWPVSRSVRVFITSVVPVNNLKKKKNKNKIKESDNQVIRLAKHDI